MSFLRHLCIALILSCLLLGQIQALPGNPPIYFTTQEAGVPTRIIHTEVRVGHHIMALEDGTTVEIQVPPFEYRTFWEWCTGATHKQPDDRFFFELHNWIVPSHVQLYEYTYDAASAQQIFGSNASLVCSRFYLLMYNPHMNQFLFCRILTPMDMMNIVKEERREREEAARRAREERERAERREREERDRRDRRDREERDRRERRDREERERADRRERREREQALDDNNKIHFTYRAEWPAAPSPTYIPTSIPTSTTPTYTGTTTTSTGPTPSYTGTKTNSPGTVYESNGDTDYNAGNYSDNGNGDNG